MRYERSLAWIGVVSLAIGGFGLAGCEDPETDPAAPGVEGTPPEAERTAPRTDPDATGTGTGGTAPGGTAPGGAGPETGGNPGAPGGT